MKSLVFKRVSSMDVEKSFTSDLGVLQRKMASFAEAVAFETLLAAQISLACLFMMTGLLLHSEQASSSLNGNDRRFPFADLYKKGTTETEAQDGSDTEDDDDEEDNDAEEPDDDGGDEDFSGEEGGEDDDDDENDAEDPAANGNQGSDDDDDDDDDDEDDDNDDDDEEEEEDDDDEEEQPPAKKRK